MGICQSYCPVDWVSTFFIIAVIFNRKFMWYEKLRDFGWVRVNSDKSALTFSFVRERERESDASKLSWEFIRIMGSFVFFCASSQGNSDLLK